MFAELLRLVAGDITNIEIDGIYAENCHSAVRLLNVIHKVENIKISNVEGSYYQYCIGFTKYYPGETTGYFDNIVLQNINASKAPRYPIEEAHMGNKDYHFPFIWIQADTRVKNILIDGVHRVERANPIETIHVGKDTVVDTLTVKHICQENLTDSHLPMFVNRGKVGNLISDSVDIADIES